MRHPTMHCNSPCVFQKLAVSNVKFDIQILSNNCHKRLNVFNSPLVLPSMAQMNSALYFLIIVLLMQWSDNEVNDFFELS